MKLILAFIFFFVVFGNIRVANATTSVPEPVSIEYVLPFAGIMPNHPLYFFKTIRDTLIEKMITNDIKKKNLEDFLQEIGVLSQEKLYNSDDPALKRYYLLKLKKGSDVLNVIEQLNKLEEVEYAEPNNIQNIF